MVSLLLFRGAVAAAAAAGTASLVAFLDADPTLYLADQWWQSRWRCWWWRHRSSKKASARGGSAADDNDDHHPTECIWIVGASSGIGAELAYQLAAESSTSSSSSSDDDDGQRRRRLHLILSSRSATQLERVAQGCRRRSVTVTVLPLDVCRERDLVSAVQHVKSLPHMRKTPGGGGGVDTVVLNVGAGHLSPALETSPATAEAVWRRNALWPMILTPLLFQHNSVFRSDGRRPPHLVVTSSVAAVLPVPLSAAYAAAKHAGLGYFRSLAAERPDVRLHVVLPGPVDTAFHENRVREPQHDKNNSNDKSGFKEVSQEKTESSSAALKMPVERCARLVRSAMRFRHSRESWIAPQPVLTALYLQQLAPGWMQSIVYRRVGPKRVALYRAGLDLYDPASWKRAQTAGVGSSKKKNDKPKDDKTKE